MIAVRAVNKPDRNIFFGGREGLTRGRWSGAIDVDSAVVKPKP